MSIVLAINKQYSIRKPASLNNIMFLSAGRHGITDNSESAMEEWQLKTKKII